ncbi:hypothetical protein [Marinobacter sp. MBR-105]|jgi:hypothetical protein
MNTAQNLPTEVELTMAFCRDKYGTEFFTSGGCGVFAALLADVALAIGHGPGTFWLIMRESEDGREQWLSHICYEHPADGGLYDIHGGPRADEHWMDKVSEEARAEDEPTPEFFDLCHESASTSEGIYQQLIELTKEYCLNTKVSWVAAHYPALRDALLSAVRQVPSDSNTKAA